MKVINLHHTRGVVPKNAARVDRSSPFGNPFMVGRDGTRAEVCDKFKRWWYAPEQVTLRFRAKKELRGKDLACWCAPAQCHANIILDYLRSQ